MASNHNNQTGAPLAEREEFRCILCSVHFPTRQAFSDHLVRRFVHLTPNILTRVIHHPLPLPPLPPPPPPADESDSDSMASLASDSSQLSSTSIINLPPPPVQSEEEEEEEEIRRNRLTLNLMGEWEPLAQIKEREDAIRAAGAEDINAPNEAAIDLELRLQTPPAALNLDLKLGL